ncbi:hypothetical protein [Niabella hibiscisoli]|nr:hypothetical protein [Niabella hibiscisoli]MCH5718006.1 hypothetical protein [Niabella hibiscisoli]
MEPNDLNTIIARSLELRKNIMRWNYNTTAANGALKKMPWLTLRMPAW